MKLLYKEFMLAAHPSLIIFTLLGCLVIVPAYPYSVIFMFGCLAPFITFMFARENNDAWFTAVVPVKKQETVKAKCLLIISSAARAAGDLHSLRCFKDCFQYPPTILWVWMLLWAGTVLVW